MSAALIELFDQKTFLTNAGTETYLVFQQGFDLPEFCAFAVHENEAEWNKLVEDYLHPILDTAASSGYGLMLDVLVWRAHGDFVEKLGRPRDEVAVINRRAVELARTAVEQWRASSKITAESFPVLIVADTGPRGDGYQVSDSDVTADEACAYHRDQLQALADTGVDLVCALTMTTAQESVGIARAAASAGLPVIISPTVETDGRLPDQSTLGDFIETVDRETNSSPLFYMVNCAHTTHLMPTLEQASNVQAAWLSRFRGFRANASAKSHEELDNSTELDRGDVAQLATQIREMKEKYQLCVIGGCCGTDHEHLAQMV